MNLTGARTPLERVRLLVGGVLPALPLVAAGTLLDVGSGNGSPGLVLALLREDIEATLLEPRQALGLPARGRARRRAPDPVAGRPCSPRRVRRGRPPGR